MRKTPQKDAWGVKFSFDELERFLRCTMDVAPVVPLRDCKKHNGRCILLRQDVDLDLYPSDKFTKIQKKLGIRSTFFVLTTSHTYNPQSARLRRMLREMSGDGFEIGLHFDPSIYGNVSKARLDQAVRDECAILERVIGAPITSIALHNPSVHGDYPMFDGYLNAYAKEIFSDERYLSDSMRIDPFLHPYRGKEPYEFIKGIKKFPVQISLHPEQFLEGGGDYVDTIVAYTSRMSETLLHDYFETLSIIRRDGL
ncbi:MAG: hypothetical protein HZB92_04705 [Euryarchaeota archaeon]|nr:hypothetical protein [Euryarchaeota archaeon]